MRLRTVAVRQRTYSEIEPLLTNEEQRKGWLSRDEFLCFCHTYAGTPGRACCDVTDRDCRPHKMATGSPSCFCNFEMSIMFTSRTRNRVKNSCVTVTLLLLLFRCCCCCCKFRFCKMSVNYLRFELIKRSMILTPSCHPHRVIRRLRTRKKEPGRKDRPADGLEEKLHEKKKKNRKKKI